MSRMAKSCSWCSAPIPDTLRFSPEEIQQIHAEETAAKQRLEGVEQDRAVKEGQQAIQKVVGEIVGTEIVKRLL
jgi:hypothetical protein